MKDLLGITIILLLLAPELGLAQQNQLTVNEVIPASGPVTGGTLVTIKGTGFTSLCQTLCSPEGVLFGNLAAPDFRVIDDSTITAVTPSHPESTVDVVRLQSFGTEARLERSFTFLAGAPLTLQGGRFTAEVSAVNKRDGKTSRGTPILYNHKFGFFYFPELTNDASNPEVFVKIVGPLPDDTFLLFYGGLTDFEYTLTVTDTITGNAKSYVKPAGEFRADLLR